MQPVFLLTCHFFTLSIILISMISARSIVLANISPSSTYHRTSESWEGSAYSLCSLLGYLMINSIFMLKGVIWILPWHIQQVSNISQMNNFYKEALLSIFIFINSTVTCQVWKFEEAQTYLLLIIDPFKKSIQKIFLTTFTCHFCLLKGIQQNPTKIERGKMQNSRS